MKVTILVAILVSSPLGFGQAPAGSTAKPEITTFMHQTLGESIEDFMRISGTKMCASSDSQAAQWCETLKKVAAGEDGVVVSSNSSGSMSLMFAGRKLVQVLVQGKADWLTSMAEFTQKYGAPDAQTANSAVWSFSDGGGISIKGQPGNLLTATFYSKEKHPKDEAKNSVSASTENKVAAQEVTSAASRTTFFGHQLGETVDQWQVLAGVDCSKHKDRKQCERARSGESVKISTPPPSGSAKKFNAGGVFDYWWDFRGGKLAYLQFTDGCSQNLSALSDKYGSPTRSQTQTWQNGYGASWQDDSFVWLKSDGTVISVTPMTHDRDNVGCVITFTTAEEIKLEEQEGQQRQAQNAPKY